MPAHPPACRLTPRPAASRAGRALWPARRAWVGANINDAMNSHLCRLNPALDPTLPKHSPTCIDSIISQLENNRNLFTGIYGFCGHRFGRGGHLYTQPKCNKNKTGGMTCNAYSGDEYLAMITPLMRYCRDNGIEFHPVINCKSTSQFPPPAAAPPPPSLERLKTKMLCEQLTTPATPRRTLHRMSSPSRRPQKRMAGVAGAWTGRPLRTTSRPG